MKANLNDYDSKDIVRIIREWTELNQKDFGRSIGRSHGAVRKYESGERDYSFKTFLNICNKHGIKIIIEKEKEFNKF